MVRPPSIHQIPVQLKLQLNLKIQTQVWRLPLKTQHLKFFLWSIPITTVTLLSFKWRLMLLLLTLNRSDPVKFSWKNNKILIFQPTLISFSGKIEVWLKRWNTPLSLEYYWSWEWKPSRKFSEYLRSYQFTFSKWTGSSFCYLFG